MNKESVQGWYWPWQDALTKRGAKYPALTMSEAVLAALDMPDPARIALARELLKGTGRVVAREVEKHHERQWIAGRFSFREACAQDLGRDEGWNACRAAMMEGGE